VILVNCLEFPTTAAGDPPVGAGETAVPPTGAAAGVAHPGTFISPVTPFISSFTELAHSWGLSVIATGIDVKEQEDLYKKLHIDLAQGELYNGFMADEVAVQIARVTGTK